LQSQEVISREHDVLFQTYKRLPIVVDHASGVEIVDVDGNAYLDFLGGIAVNVLGYSHPKIISAIENQIRRYMHLSNYYYQEPQVQLAELLCSASGYERVFFCNSGSETVEGALKLARRIGHQKSKYDLVGFSGGFHGRTYAALSVMDKPLYKDGMGPFVAKTIALPFNDIDALESRIDESTAAVILEFIQGEGGLSEPTPEFVKRLFELRDEYDFVVIADEVQTGIGRTGSFFAFEKYGVRPDIVTVAKSVGGGLPLGAILTTHAHAGAMLRGQHGTTFGGNAVACVAGMVVVNEVLNGLMQHVLEIGRYLHASLSALAEQFPKQIREIRGRGCMQGAVMNSDASPYVNRLLDKKVIINSTSVNVIRLVPPYVITEENVDTFIRAFREVLLETEAQL